MCCLYTESFPKETGCFFSTQKKDLQQKPKAAEKKGRQDNHCRHDKERSSFPSDCERDLLPLSHALFREEGRGGKQDREEEGWQQHSRERDINGSSDGGSSNSSSSNSNSNDNGDIADIAPPPSHGAAAAADCCRVASTKSGVVAKSASCCCCCRKRLGRGRRERTNPGIQSTKNRPPTVIM